MTKINNFMNMTYKLEYKILNYFSQIGIQNQESGLGGATHKSVK